MTDSLNSGEFQENLLRLYLGKYESRFKSLVNRQGITLHTDPYPILVIQLHHTWVSLSEYIEVEEEDPYYGSFDYYQINIIAVPVGDPDGIKKIEKAVGKSFLTGTQS